MLRRISSRQLSEWMAFYNLEPFGQSHTDFLIAQLTNAINNRWRNQSEGPTHTTDWLPLHKPEPQDWRDMLRIIRRAKGA